MKIQGVVVNVLRDVDGTKEFLFLKRSGGVYEGHWWPVTGTCIEGEAPVATALRELMEETELVPQAMYHLGLELKHSDGVSKLAGYVAYVSPDCKVKLNYEHVECRWLAVLDVYAVVPDPVHSVIDHIKCRFVDSAPDASQLAWRE